MTTKITTDNIASETLTTILGPKVSSIVYPGDDTAANTAGGDSITLLGSGFNSGASVIVNGTSAGVVTVVSSTQITFTAPAQTAGTYVIYVINSDGGTAISIPGISYSGTPNWSTSAGSVGTAYETGSISTTVTATGDAPITYSVVSGTLPTGSTLNTSSGLISGTASATASSTTYSFTIKASDAQNQDTNRAFTITVNPDVVTWSTPTNNETYNVSKDIAIANVAMSATSASGGSITYTADTLPTGLSITGANIAGTPTVAANTSTTLTATSTTTRSATRTINWVVTVANDTYFKNTTLLLNGETTVTPFISDSSANSLALTINGDIKPTLFNPYQGDGYYSNYFDGSGDYLTPPLLNFGTTNFTVEAWIYPTSLDLVNNKILYISTGANTRLAFRLNSANKMDLYLNAVTPGVTTYVTNTVLTENKWYHLAAVRNSGTIYLYVNGVLDNTPAASVHDINANDVYTYIGSIGASTQPFTGYISNLRITNTAVYITAFTPSTTPLTAVSGTMILTCQSNRFIDNSSNAYTITKTGDTSVSPNIPFTPNSSYSTYGSTYFDGTGDSLTAPSNVALNLTGDFTIEFWAYPTASISSKSIAGTTSSSMHFDSGGYFYLLNSTGQYLRATDASFLTLNTWTHVSISRSGSTLKFFKNGIDNGVAENVGSASTATFTFSGLNIGYSPHVNASAYLTGYISNFRIVKGTAVYTTAFTPPTTPLTAIANTSLLTLQYNGGATNQAIIDNSTFNNIITRAGNASQGTFSPYSVTGWSNYFDGNSDYLNGGVNSAYSFGSGDFTIESWVYITARGSSGSCFAGTWAASGRGWIWISNPTQFGFVYSTNGNDELSILATYTIPLNAWTHLATVRNGNTITNYANGVSIGSGSVTGVTISTPTQPLYIGANKQDVDSSINNYQMNGYISNFRIVKGTAVYTSAFTPPTTPLTAIANTSLLTCQSNRLIDNSINNFTLTRAGDTSVQAFGPFGSVPEAVPISYSNYFDGTGDYLTTPANSAFVFGTSDFTIEAWIYRTVSSASYIAIITNWSTGWFFGFNNNTFTLLKSGGATVISDTVTSSLNSWNHYCVSRSGSTVRLFVDGVLKNTVTDANDFSGSNTIHIGITDGVNHIFTGSISNLRVVKGTGLYTSTFTPSTTPLTAISGTSLLTCQSTRMIDNSTNNVTLTAAGNTVPRIFNPFGYTAQSATSYTPSLHGGSAYFDGNDYLQVLTPPANTRVWWDKNFTVECWIYPTTLTNSSYNQGGTETPSLIGNASTSSDGNYWTFGPINDGTVRFYYYNGGSVFSAVTTETVKINQWNHLAFVNISGTGYKMYINGVGTSNIAVSGTPLSGSELPLIIGYKYYSTGSKGFTGYFSDARITAGAVYTSNFVPPAQALSNYSTTYPASLLLNFNNGGIIDQHGTNVLETVGNAQLSTGVKKYNVASMYFDGSGDGLLAPSSANFDFGTGNFTIEMWINFTNVTSDWQAVISRAYTIAGGWRLYKDSGTNQLRWYAGGSNLVLTTGSTLANNTWGHVAVVRNNGTITVYIDGVNRGSAADSTNYNPGTYAVEIGQGVVTSAYPVTGYIDDLRITKGYARYTANFTAPTSALVTK